MEKHILSKSTYIKGEQCLKQLYLHKKRPFLRDHMPPERLAIFRRGTDVGIYAQKLFPGGIDAGPKHYSQYQKAIARTAELMEQGREVIYEAAFQAHKTLILLDILVKNGAQWDAYEVKSSKSLSETYYKDAALQYHVLTESGVDIRSFSLIHINTDYVRGTEPDMHQLFVITDVTDEVKKRSSHVQQKIEEELAILSQAHSPKIDIGLHCRHPYDCDFIGHCWKGISSPSFFDIPALDLEQQFALYHTYGKLAKMPADATLPNEVGRMQIQAQLEQKEFLHTEKIRKLFPPQQPLYLLKVLHFTPALPLYENTRPYEPLCFGFGLQQINRDGSLIPIHSFVYEGTNNPKPIIRQMIKELIPQDALVLTYANSEAKIEAVSSLDLSALLKEGLYYHPKITKDYSSRSLGLALGIKKAFKSIDMDVVAAQYYDEIRNQNKDSEQKRQHIAKYLERELKILALFVQKLLAA
jgi:hypothetical protein